MTRVLMPAEPSMPVSGLGRIGPATRPASGPAGAGLSRKGFALLH